MKPEDIKRLEDKFDHAILLARQSTPDSLSPILGGIKRDLARIEAKVDEMKPKIDLIYPKVTGDIRREEVWAQLRGMFKSGSGVILTIVATGAAIAVLAGWGKQGLIHWLRQ